MIKPVNNRVLAKKIKDDKDGEGIVSVGTNAQLDKFMFAEVVSSSIELCKKGDIVIVPSYVDIIKDGKKEYYIFHESDIVAIK